MRDRLLAVSLMLFVLDPRAQALATSARNEVLAEIAPEGTPTGLVPIAPDEETGKPLQDATALFTVSVPGLEAIVSGELTTNGQGTASFSTMIPKGATPGGGLATVLVTARGEDDATDRQVLTILE